jgi:hypothetical protein
MRVAGGRALAAASLIQLDATTTVRRRVTRAGTGTRGLPAPIPASTDRVLACVVKARNNVIRPRNIKFVAATTPGVARKAAGPVSPARALELALAPHPQRGIATSTAMVMVIHRPLPRRALSRQDTLRTAQTVATKTQMLTPDLVTVLPPPTGAVRLTTLATETLPHARPQPRRVPEARGHKMIRRACARLSLESAPWTAASLTLTDLMVLYAGRTTLPTHGIAPMIRPWAVHRELRRKAQAPQ